MPPPNTYCVQHAANLLDCDFNCCFDKGRAWRMLQRFSTDFTSILKIMRLLYPTLLNVSYQQFLHLSATGLRTLLPS